MNSHLHAQLHAHGILVVGDVDLPAPEAHARLRDALRRRYPAGLGSYVFWRRAEPGELHVSDASVAALVSAAR
ncbi:hypothetical protein OM076_16960 [Solirubrobacter ginsenosidimutans]|uniref:Uncharacterized protein n=1 Tax=Solirubrobacter ginsenosidimutans TaxID=490573 RepID=A0A9X3MT87_9ACTN|nr:hypothetical protein [Solirubrobacter ginsenosidimutans]MDA0161967.1 hypothetical protein [Solirubrobacter ginsenosidimutans]